VTLQQLTLIEIIEKVKSLIDTGNGDAGRLHHILEYLKNNRPLYRSDQIYLEGKLNFKFFIENDDSIYEENELLPKIQQIIYSGNGDPGRLQHIYDMLLNNKSLYNSDAAYLESKLNSSSLNKQMKSNVTQHTAEFSLPLKEIPAESISKFEIRGSMPKGWNQRNESTELSEITKNMQNEKQKIEQQEKISNEIILQRSKLTDLITHRKEYEEKITREKSLLASQIKGERLRIETQTKLSEEITSQKEELIKIKKEREKIIKDINAEKSKITKDLNEQKKLLVQAQLDQEELEKQVQNEQTMLSQMAEEQKLRLTEQAKIAHEIKSKQVELEKTKQDYDDIVSKINEEKVKFAESEKLKKLIKKQEEDLINAKEERLNLINIISKEKVLITKKVNDEKAKLKSQIKLNAQLKKEEHLFELLKKKHDKIEQQIKLKNQKLKEQQEKIKKQINDKNKKLKSLEKKSKSDKNALTKTVKKKIKKEKK